MGRRSDRPRARGTSDRRRDRGREGGGTAEAEIRKAGAGGRNCVMRWGAARPRAASLSASAFPWAKGSSELVWAGVQEIEIELLHLIKKGIDARDDLLVGNRFDGAGCEQFNAVETVGDKIVTR